MKYYVSTEGDDSYNGKTLVWDGSNGPLATIGAALAKVGDGTSSSIAPMGHIVVATGTYTEHFNIEDRNIILTSMDPYDWDVVEATVIDAGAPSNPTDSVIEYGQTTDNRCELRGLTITGGTGTYYPGTGYVFGGGVFTLHTTPTISRCIIRNNTAGRGGGLAGCSGMIEHCIIKENTADDSGNGRGGGLFSCFNGGIANCVIVDNYTDQGGGGLEGCAWNEIV